MKLTKADTKIQDEVMEILKKPELTNDDREFVLDNYNPAADNNITPNGAFFTPSSLASDFALFAHCNYPATYIDLCAGIGVLTNAVRNFADNNSKYVCIELNPDFVEIGKKVVPYADWICGDVNDREIYEKLLEKYGYFDTVISNPPFGKNKADDYKYKWLNYQGTRDLMVAEIGTKIGKSVDLILPPMSVPYSLNKVWLRKETTETIKWRKNNPDFDIIVEASLDYSTYEFKNTKIYPLVAHITDKNGESQFTPNGI